MSPDEYFALFHEKYGNDFNWMLTSSDSFACELEMVLCTVYFAGKADDYWNGMGAANIAAGDERNRYISLRSWAWSGYCFVIVAAAASVILKITGNDAMCLISAMGACLLMVMYAVFYFVLRRKY